MKKTLNEEIIATIRNSLSANENIVVFLGNLFDWSKESIYRRVRCEIAFTYEELVLLATKLNFSLDNVIRLNQSQQVLFELSLLKTTNEADLYCERRERLATLSAEISKAESSESLFALNYIPFSFCLYLEHLTKFDYYKWMHQKREISPETTLSELVCPQKLVDIRESWINQDRTNSRASYILDSNVFLSVVTEINYFYNRNLITALELAQLKQDLDHLVSLLVDLAMTGIASRGANILLYLSPINITTNHSYLHYDENEWCYLEVYGIDILQSYYPEACKVQKEWLEHHKKYSTLITKCNEVEMLRYFEKQRAYIAQMGS